MPNHCSNCLIVAGEASDMAEFRNKIPMKDGERDFEFDHFVPMPKELTNLNVGHNTIDGVDCKMWRRVPIDPNQTLDEIDCLPWAERKDKITEVPVSEQEAQTWREKYGADNWYDWAIKTWGTKWGGYDCDVVSDEATAFRVTFNTAWSPPIPFVTKLAEMFPKLGFTLAYAEGGACFYGETFWNNGEMVSDFAASNFWNPSPEPCEDNDEYIDDLESQLTPQCFAHIERYGLHTGG